jgi:hypothetical protein
MESNQSATAIFSSIKPLTIANPIGGIYASPQTVTLTSNKPAIIYYTTNGSTPTLSSANSNSPVNVEIPTTTTLKFFAKDGTNQEPLRVEKYSIVSDGFLYATAGWLHTVAIKSDGSLWAWGNNDHGQLGDGTIIKKASPIQIGSGITWSSVAGWLHTVATKSDGSLWAWPIGRRNDNRKTFTRTGWYR